MWFWQRDEKEKNLSKKINKVERLRVASQSAEFDNKFTSDFVDRNPQTAPLKPESILLSWKMSRTDFCFSHKICCSCCFFDRLLLIFSFQLNWNQHIFYYLAALSGQFSENFQQFRFCLTTTHSPPFVEAIIQLDKCQSWQASESEWERRQSDNTQFYKIILN